MCHTAITGTHQMHHTRYETNMQNDPEVSSQIAQAAWQAFRHARPDGVEWPGPCLPAHRRNRSHPDSRDLSSLLKTPLAKRPPPCEHPSERRHWQRLHSASLALAGRALTVVVIGANEGASEGNEWVGELIRRYGEALTRHADATHATHMGGARG